MQQTNASIPDETLSWLLEESSPGVRYLALTELCGELSDDHAVEKVRSVCYSTGEIAQVLDHMEPAGYWVRPGHGYCPKYRGTAWSLITLSQLGAKAEYDSRISTSCEYYLNVNMSPDGKFTSNGSPSGTIDCLQGNMCAALSMLGCHDKRLEAAYDWLARSITGDGVDTYYSYKSGPKFLCGINNDRPCAWGAVKAVLALGMIPEEQRTAQVKKAIQSGIDFLLGSDPATAEYPTKDDKKPSRNWWKLGFPMYYISDVLQNLEALVSVGCGSDNRIQNALELIWNKRDDQNRWTLDYDYAGKTWIDVGAKRQPNKWVTFRVASLFNKVERSQTPVLQNK